MATRHLSFLSILLSLFPFSFSQLPNTTGYTCTTPSYPCQSYVYYRATSPDLATVADLFSLSRLMISVPNNISSPSSSLSPHQPLFVPITCSCNFVKANVNANTSINVDTNINADTSINADNSSTNADSIINVDTSINVNNNVNAKTNTSTNDGVSIKVKNEGESETNMSYASINYTIQKGDTFYLVSTLKFQNLTTYQSVQAVNPSLIPTELDIGVNVVFPIFCKCPSRNSNETNFLISYVFQPFDTFASIAKLFGSDVNSIVEVNRDIIRPFETVFVPVSKLPKLYQRDAYISPPPRHRSTDRGLVIGLGIGLGICVVLLILVSTLFGYREKKWKKRIAKRADEEKIGNRFVKGTNMKNFVADVSECLDKYKVYEIDELRRGTEGFDEKCLIQGCVYKGYIGEEFYAIKKMKWNASEELKILQKVNHGNLVKLEGFCIDSEDASCYLVYEYVENGSLHSWLHGNKNEMLNWKTRLRIAIDVANGLQYVHEHTRPRVVHKDIKSSNILLDSNMRGKIANFGLARSGCNAITTHIVGTQGYISPEYMSDGIVSTKMDIFSFGVVLLELVSGREAVDGEGRILWTSADGILEGGEERRERRLRSWMDKVLVKESCSMESVMNVMGVAIACLNRDPSKRPSMVDIVYALCKSDELFFDIADEGVSQIQVLAR